jgi:hypothetical protein
VALGIIQQTDVAWFIETLTAPDVLTLLSQTRDKDKSAGKNKNQDSGGWQEALRRKNRKLEVFRHIDSKRDNLLDLEEVVQFYNNNFAAAKHFWENVDKSVDDKVSWMDFASSAISESLSNAVSDQAIEVPGDEEAAGRHGTARGIKLSAKHWRYDRLRSSTVRLDLNRQKSDVNPKGMRAAGGQNKARKGLVQDDSQLESSFSLRGRYVGDGDADKDLTTDDEDSDKSDWNEDTLIAAMRAQKVETRRTERESNMMREQLPYSEMRRREEVIEKSLEDLFPHRYACTLWTRACACHVYMLVCTSILCFFYVCMHTCTDNTGRRMIHDQFMVCMLRHAMLSCYIHTDTYRYAYDTYICTGTSA